jgi:hypothetical protein
VATGALVFAQNDEEKFRKLREEMVRTQMATSPDIGQFFSDAGRRGAKKQSAEMTAKQRRERAKKAARAKWAKWRKRKGKA